MGKNDPPFENDKPLMIKFTCSNSLKDELIQPWNHALIAKLIKSIAGFTTFDKMIREIWKSRGEMEIIVLGFGCYIIKFDK